MPDRESVTVRVVRFGVLLVVLLLALARSLSAAADPYYGGPPFPVASTANNESAPSVAYDSASSVFVFVWEEGGNIVVAHVPMPGARSSRNRLARATVLTWPTARRTTGS